MGAAVSDHRRWGLVLGAVMAVTCATATEAPLPHWPDGFPDALAVNAVEMEAMTSVLSHDHAAPIPGTAARRGAVKTPRFAPLPASLPHASAWTDAASVSPELLRGDGDDPRHFLAAMAEAARARRPENDPVVRYAESRGLIRRDPPAQGGAACSDHSPPPPRPECR